MFKKEAVDIKRLIIGKAKPKLFDNDKFSLKFDKINKHIEIVGYENENWEDIIIQEGN